MKVDVLVRYEQLQYGEVENFDLLFNCIIECLFYNVFKFDFVCLIDVLEYIVENLSVFICGFLQNVQDIFFEWFKLGEQIDKFDGVNLFFQVVQCFLEIDLYLDVVDNYMMGLVFEDFICWFVEQLNEMVGEYFMLCDVIEFMVNLFFIEDFVVFIQFGIVCMFYDLVCGMGGMFLVVEEYLCSFNFGVEFWVFGQEFNDEIFVICKVDMFIKGQQFEQIKLGNIFSEQGYLGQYFDYMFFNLFFGVEWKKVWDKVKDEYESKGFVGCFGVGLLCINDGLLFFLQYMFFKMKLVDLVEGVGGLCFVIVFNGLLLFIGDVGFGESEICCWIFENDWFEVIVVLFDQFFFNMGIFIYIWVFINCKVFE